MGWPGEQMSAEAGRNRVYVAIAKLRRLGLDAVVVRTPLGYTFDPAVQIVRSAVGSTPVRLGDSVGDAAPKD
jgi:hypothetical protein